jgi:uncharacterized protein YcfL
MTHRARPRILAGLGMVALAFLTLSYLAACKSQPQKEAAPEAAAAAETVDIDSVSAVMGKAQTQVSGVFDVNQADTELQIVYHFYTDQMSDIDDDIGVDLAPKIREFYRTFKTIDRVVFSVEVSHPTTLDVWTPYCSFATTRQLIEETDWTNLLAADFFKVVLELKYAEE